jgi:hypothetical protein
MSKYFFIFFLIYSCSTEKLDLAGKYKSEKLSLSEKVFYFNNSKIKSLELVLFKDSTFNYNACGLIFDGKWILKKEKIYLKVYNYEWKDTGLVSKNKSFNQSNNPDFFIYNIKKNSLLSIIKKENRKDIIKLKKEK